MNTEPTSPIADRAALHDLIVRFARGLDTCDWERYRSVFTDEIDLDYSSWSSGAVGRWRADDWVHRATLLFPGFSATQHSLTDVDVEIDGDEAQLRAYVRAEHVIVADRVGDGAWPTPGVFTLNGYYDDGCVRTDDGWRIARKRLVVQWCTGDADVMRRAAARAAESAAAPREQR